MLPIKTLELMDRIQIGCVTIQDAVAELSVMKEDRTKVYVTYYRRKTNRPITEYKGAKTIAMIDNLLVKVKARIKENTNLTLWSY